MDSKTKFTHFILRFINAKKLASKSILHPKRAKRFSYSYKLKKYVSEHLQIQQHNVVTFSSNPKKSGKHLVLFHGGAYTVQVQAGHWWLMEQLLKNIECKVSFIEYPLAPEHDYIQTHKMLNEAYQHIHSRNENDQFYFIGDSAGGGLALAFAQTLRDNNVPYLPIKIALLSPWLDLGLNNPAINEIEPLDLLLSSKTLQQAAKWFAKGTSLKTPILSPLFGNQNNLNSIAIFVGTHEIFLPDCRLLKQKIENSNTQLYYHEYPEMQHDFGLFPIKERTALLDDLINYLV